MNITVVVALVALSGLAVFFHARGTGRRRAAFITTYPFPVRVRARVKERYPHLDDAQVSQVLRALRAYFHLCHKAGRRMVAMPSQAVDVAWHEFILFTRNYQDFCKRGLGRFLHHTPAEAMTAPTLAQEGIKRAWRLACLHEGLNPTAATKLPLLFAIDMDLNIPDGFRYALNCRTAGLAQGGGNVYCGSHIGGGGGCSGGGCSGDLSGAGGDGGCGGGCGGD